MMIADALDIFVVAEQFWRASLVLREARKQEVDVQNVIETCSALTLELYLKCLFVLETGERPPGIHDLNRLFHKLQKTTQAEIRRYFKAHSHHLEEDITARWSAAGRKPRGSLFQFILKASADAFERFRYVFEDGLPADKGWAADMIMEGARKAILRRRPDWSGAKQIGSAATLRARES